jgi:hypothetical protein
MSISFWLIIPFFLAIVVLVFVGMLFAMRRREQEIAWLDKHGIRCRATVVHVRPVKEVGLFQKQSALMKIVRNMQPHVEDDTEQRYELIAQWISPQSQQRYVFKRRYYGFPDKQYTPGDTVEVLVDMQNPQRHYVSIRSSSF